MEGKMYIVSLHGKHIAKTCAFLQMIITNTKTYQTRKDACNIHIDVRVSFKPLKRIQ